MKKVNEKSRQYLRIYIACKLSHIGAYPLVIEFSSLSFYIQFALLNHCFVRFIAFTQRNTIAILFLVCFFPCFTNDTFTYSQLTPSIIIYIGCAETRHVFSLL